MRRVTKILIVALVLGLSATALGIGMTDLVAYWKFDEGEGAVAHDSVGNYDGTISGAVWATGISGSALVYDGNDNRCDMGDRTGLEGFSQVTIAAWVYWEPGSAFVRECIAGKELVYKIDINHDTGTIRFLTGNDWTGSMLTSNTAIQQYNWYHIAATYDGIVKKIYINGVQDANTLNTSGSLGSNSRSFAVGAFDKGGDWNRHIKGKIDEVCVFDRALTELEVQDLYRNGIEEPALIGLEIEGPNKVAEEASAQYKVVAVYDNNSTKNVTDLTIWEIYPDNYADIDDSGLLSTYELVMPTEDVTIYAQYEESNDIVLQAEKDVQIFALCSDGAIELDGVDDYVRLPYNEPVWLPEKDFTISLWAFCERDYGVARGPESFLDLNNAEEGSYNSENGCHLLRKTSDGKILFRMATLTDVDDNLLSEGSIEPGRWYHIVAVRNGGWQGIYIDSQLDSSRSCTADPIKYQGTYDNDSVTIGKSSSKDNPSSDFLKGLVDEVMIFNRAMSGEEVADLMYFGMSSDANLIGYWNFNEEQGQVAYDSSGDGNDGYLGDDPCNADNADPCRIEVGAPLHCTPRQMIRRNLEGALERKAIAQERIDEALERERASAKLLMEEMQACKKWCHNPWNILWPAREIYVSMRLEIQCRKKLCESMRALERALKWLFVEPAPAQMRKMDKQNKNSENR